MASSLKKLYGYSKSKADRGVWITLQEAQCMEDGTVISPPIRVRIGKLGTVAYNQAMDKALAPYQTKIRLTRKLSLEENTKIAIQCYADAVLFDWEGVTDDDDTPLPCTRANKVEMLTNYPDFRIAIEAYAGDLENFQQDIEVDAGNSLPTSSTNLELGVGGSSS